MPDPVLVVELPVCTVCEPPLIGKRPQVLCAGTPLRHYCKGTIERPHKKARMEMRRFVEERA